VEATARAASEFGYNITFATDAMTDRVESAHNHSIQNIFPRLGERGTTKEIIEMLNKEINH
jgi:nicotinamidase-related amidase